MRKEGLSELKKGEIKEILKGKFEKYLPEFKYANYDSRQYNFQRTKEYGNFTVWETLHVSFSLKHKNFSCSVSSRVNKNLISSNSYNTNLLNPHVDLIFLKKGTRVIAIEDAYYFSNGKTDVTTKVVEQICKDFVMYGVPFLDRQFESLQTNKILNTGLNYIQQLKVNKQELGLQINAEMKQVGYITSRLKHPIFVSLKETLQAIPQQAGEDKQKIPGLVFELLELLWTEQ